MAVMRVERGNGVGGQSAQSVNVETIYSENGEEGNPITQGNGTRGEANVGPSRQGGRGNVRGRGGH